MPGSNLAVTVLVAHVALLLEAGVRVEQGVPNLPVQQLMQRLAYKIICKFFYRSYKRNCWLITSVAEPEPGAGAAGVATFRAAPEPVPIFLLVGAGSRSRTF